MKHTDLHISMQPQEISWHCPYCGRKEALSYGDFILIYGHQWQYKQVYCENCQSKYYFDSNRL